MLALGILIVAFGTAIAQAPETGQGRVPGGKGSENGNGRQGMMQQGMMQSSFPQGMMQPSQGMMQPPQGMVQSSMPQGTQGQPRIPSNGRPAGPLCSVADVQGVLALPDLAAGAAALMTTKAGCAVCLMSCAQVGASTGVSFEACSTESCTTSVVQGNGSGVMISGMMQPNRPQRSDPPGQPRPQGSGKEPVERTGPPGAFFDPQGSGNELALSSSGLSGESPAQMPDRPSGSSMGPYGRGSGSGSGSGSGMHEDEDEDVQDDDLMLSGASGTAVPMQPGAPDPITALPTTVIASTDAPSSVSPVTTIPNIGVVYLTLDATADMLVPSALAGIRTSLVQYLSLYTGVTEANLQVKLFSGSVILEVTIALPPNNSIYMYDSAVLASQLAADVESGSLSTVGNGCAPLNLAILQRPMG